MIFIIGLIIGFVGGIFVARKFKTKIDTILKST